MREERLLSVGIDIGTSTTQCVFSTLTLSNLASSFSVPRIQITDKRVLYRAPVRLTPLLSADTIDTQELERMISADYAEAGIVPKNIQLGAVIITGETARKQNARAVTQALSRLAGDFVVATAGPALESILAGRGSGAAELSRATGKTVLNLDIGGGTTNMALFDRGDPIADGCLDIGGRLLCFEEDNETVLSFTGQMERIAADIGLSLAVGQRLPFQQQAALCRRMADIREEAAGFRPRTPLHDALTVEHALPRDIAPALFTFSGGVADCVYGCEQHPMLFHDLGSRLGQAVHQSLFFTQGRVERPKETSHATVIGAGAYSVSVSGSTITYQGMQFPMPSLPAGKVRLTCEADLASLEDAVKEQYRIFDGECAIYMDGIQSPSYAMLEAAAQRLARAMEPFSPKVVILRQDMAKALGQALSRQWPEGTPFLCIDGISLAYGDTLDIGAPLSNGRVIPVIVKTFAFAEEK